MSSMAAGMQNRKMIERLNRVEGFYSGELLAWHAFERKRQSLEVSGQAVGFDHAYAEKVEGVSEGSDVIPYNIIETRKYAPSKGLVRRHVPERFIASEDMSSSCGRVGFAKGKKNYRVCLASSGSTAEKPVLYLAYIPKPPAFGVDGIDLVRILSNGEIDTSFGTQGFLQIRGIFSRSSSFPFYPDIWPLFVKRSDGKLLFQVSFGLFLLDSAGTLESSFGESGKRLLPQFVLNYPISLRRRLGAHDDVLILNRTAQDSLIINRILNDGNVDGSFGAQGITIDISSDPGVKEVIYDSITKPEGYYFLVNLNQPANSVKPNEIRLAKVLPSLNLDSTFGESGSVLIGTKFDSVNFAITNSSRILLATRRTEYIVGGHIVKSTILRLMPDGSIDSTFGTNGSVDVSELGAQLFFERDISILGTSAQIVSQKTILKLTRLTIEGVLDNSFGINGSITVDIDGYGIGNPLGVRQVQFAPDGSCYVLLDFPATIGISGMTELKIVILHVLKNGSLDAAFGTGGQAQFSFPSWPTSMSYMDLM